MASIPENYPYLVAEWHPKNSKSIHEYSHGSEKKVWWVCSKGHEWISSPNNRTSRNNGCPYCSGRLPVHGVNDLETLRPDLVVLWSPNNLLLPKQVSPKSNKKVTWMCARNHEWVTSVAHVTSGDRCPICSGRTPDIGTNDLATLYPDLVSQWSPRNSKSPSDYLPKSAKSVEWICDRGHAWMSRIHNRTNGRGCPTCRLPIISPMILCELRKSFPDTISEYKTCISWPNKKNRKLTVDFYIPEVNAVIEYDGEKWHSGELPNSTSPERDLLKTNLLIEEGYKVVRLRQGKLFHLDVTHPRLLQKTFYWTREPRLVSLRLEDTIDFLHS